MKGARIIKTERCIFTNTVGITIHDYAQRRQLTEAAKLLVFSDKPIIEVAFICGYESQQAFSSAFKAMYKVPPARYRDDGTFYPLQLRFTLHRNVVNKIFTKEDICLAEKTDIPVWMDLMRLVIDGYPVMDETDYLNEIEKCIEEKRGIVLKDKNILIGAMTFSDHSGSIDFLGIHPQYRKQGIQKLFLDVTNLIRLSKKKHLKFNMLIDYCIGKAAVAIKEFYILPVGEKLIQYDTIAVNMIVKNKDGEVSSCDILYTEDLVKFNREYLKYTVQVANTSQDRDLSGNSMVIGTSAIVATEIDGAVGMNSGIFNNPFIIWGKYRKRVFRYYLPISFQFHHTQMDGAHAGRFLENLQNEINRLK